MSDAPQNTGNNYVELAADIVSAYVSKNSVRPSEIPELIASVHSTLTKVATGAAEKPKEELTPPVSAKKSLTPDFLISLEDGKRYKSLKRHLKGRGLTPEQYREKWGLSHDYPMVAPNYAKQRSELAKSLGLGQLRRQRNRAGDAAPVEAAQAAPAKGGRKKVAEPA